MRLMPDRSSTLAAASLLFASGGASAQTVDAVLVPSSPTVAPGSSINIVLEFDYDTSGFVTGFFGQPGFYGYGGDIVVDSGPAASAGSLMQTINPSLFSGMTVSPGSTPQLFRSAAGRGLASALADPTSGAVSFDVAVDAGAPDGPLGLRFDGAVALSLGDELVTFSTTPGINQGMINQQPLVIQIVTPPNCVGDVTTTGATIVGQPGFGEPDGIADLDDLGYFLNFWLAGVAAADFTTTGATIEGQPGFGVQDGVIDLDDLGYFLNFWLQGCS